MSWIDNLSNVMTTRYVFAIHIRFPSLHVMIEQILASDFPDWLPCLETLGPWSRM